MLTTTEANHNTGFVIQMGLSKCYKKLNIKTIQLSLAALSEPTQL